jgi:mutator protein MutT
VYHRRVSASHRPRKLVVAGLARDGAGRVLLTRRRADQAMGGKWELPGGKIEPGEAPRDALERELREELGCGSEIGAVEEVLDHRYVDFDLLLLVYACRLVGEPRAVEVAELAWVEPVDLTGYDVLPADRPLMERLAGQAWEHPAPAAREGASAFERMSQDALTGALGYPYLRLRLQDELERSARHTRPLCLILVDVDGLQALNDELGRAAGDFALRELADALRADLRSGDFVGRWGGGGFALVLPEAALSSAYGTAERLRAEMAARRFTVQIPGRRPAPLRMTVSCGVASAIDSGASRADSLLARADAALERAKSGGRNRSVVDGADRSSAS